MPAKLKLSSNLREPCNDLHQTSHTDSNLTPRLFPYHPSGLSQIKTMLWSFPKKRVWNKQVKDVTWFRCRSKYILGTNPWFHNRTWFKKNQKTTPPPKFWIISFPPLSQSEKETYWVWVGDFFVLIFLRSRTKLWDRKKMRPLLWVCS